MGEHANDTIPPTLLIIISQPTLYKHNNSPVTFMLFNTLSQKTRWLIHAKEHIQMVVGRVYFCSSMQSVVSHHSGISQA